MNRIGSSPPSSGHVAGELERDEVPALLHVLVEQGGDLVADRVAVGVEPFGEPRRCRTPRAWSPRPARAAPGRARRARRRRRGLRADPDVDVPPVVDDDLAGLDRRPRCRRRSARSPAVTVAGRGRREDEADVVGVGEHVEQQLDALLLAVPRQDGVLLVDDDVRAPAAGPVRRTRTPTRAPRPAGRPARPRRAGRREHGRGQRVRSCAQATQ